MRQFVELLMIFIAGIVRPTKRLEASHSLSSGHATVIFQKRTIGRSDLLKHNLSNIALLSDETDQ